MGPDTEKYEALHGTEPEAEPKQGEDKVEDNTTENTSGIAMISKLSVDELKFDNQEIHRWLNMLCKRNDMEARIIVKKYYEMPVSYMAILYTSEREYFITFKPPSTEYGGYMGCTYTSRKPWAGEEHRRGADRMDGPYNTDTWMKILADIVSSEMVELKT